MSAAAMTAVSSRTWADVCRYAEDNPEPAQRPAGAPVPLAPVQHPREFSREHPALRLADVGLHAQKLFMKEYQRQLQHHFMNPGQPAPMPKIGIQGGPYPTIGVPRKLYDDRIGEALAAPTEQGWKDHDAFLSQIQDLRDQAQRHHEAYGRGGVLAAWHGKRLNRLHEKIFDLLGRAGHLDFLPVGGHQSPDTPADGGPQKFFSVRWDLRPESRMTKEDLKEFHGRKEAAGYARAWADVCRYAEDNPGPAMPEPRTSRERVPREHWGNMPPVKPAAAPAMPMPPVKPAAAPAMPPPPRLPAQTLLRPRPGELPPMTPEEARRAFHDTDPTFGTFSTYGPAELHLPASARANLTNLQQLVDQHRAAGRHETADSLEPELNWARAWHDHLHSDDYLRGKSLPHVMAHRSLLGDQGSFRALADWLLENHGRPMDVAAHFAADRALYEAWAARRRLADPVVDPATGLHHFDIYWELRGALASTDPALHAAIDQAAAEGFWRRHGRSDLLKSLTKGGMSPSTHAVVSDFARELIGPKLKDRMLSLGHFDPRTSEYQKFADELVKDHLPELVGRLVMARKRMAEEHARRGAEELRQAPPRRNDEPTPFARSWADVCRYAESAALPPGGGFSPGGDSSPGPGSGATPAGGSGAAVGDPAGHVARRLARLPPHTPFTGWADQIPVKDLHNAHAFSWGGPGLGNIKKLHLPGGGTYFAKVATDRGHNVARPGSGVREPSPPAFSAADHSAELTANRLRRLIGQPGVVPMAEWKPGWFGDRHVVTPELPGMNYYELVRALAGKPESYRVNGANLAKNLRRPGMEDALKAVARSASPAQVGNTAFGNWFVNSGDRHKNQYRWGMGDVVGIDDGYSVWPRAETHHHWAKGDALRRMGDYSDAEWFGMPVDRTMVANAVRHGDRVLAEVAAHGRHHPGDGKYGRREMMQHYRDKLDFLGRVLAAKPSGPLTLGDFGVTGEMYDPRLRRFIPPGGGES